MSWVKILLIWDTFAPNLLTFQTWERGVLPYYLSGGCPFSGSNWTKTQISWVPEDGGSCAYSVWVRDGAQAWLWWLVMES